MNEKRFKKMDTIIDPFPIWDTVEEKGYNCTDTLDLLVDLLNEQISIIRRDEISIQTMMDNMEKLEKENENLRNVCSHLKKENQSLIENIFDIYEKVKWVSR